MSTLCRSSDCVVLATYEVPVVHDMVASIVVAICYRI